MKNTVIPAQITTVEDTIAGNLNFTQIVLLVSSLFANVFTYALITPRMAFSPLKVAIMVVIFIVFIVLALRIKGRIVLNWLSLLATYNLRSHLYIFNKNTLFARNVVVPKHTLKEVVVKTKALKEESNKAVLSDFDYETIARSNNLNLNFKRKSIYIVKTHV